MRGSLAGLCAVWCGADASAGAWVQAPGETFARVSVTFEETDGQTGQRYDLYGEHGLDENWTLTAKAETVTFPDASDFDGDGFRVTLRRAIFRKERFLVSAEGGAVQGAAIGGAAGCDGFGGEARLGMAASGLLSERRWFAFADAARREFEDDCHRNRLEIGVGSEVYDNVYLLNQLWFERGTDNAESDKFETGLL